MDLFVVGAGYVGLTTAVGFAELGHDVTVHDIDSERVGVLTSGRSPILEDGLEASLRSSLAAQRLRFTVDPDPPGSTMAAIVCVPTPTGADGLLDLSIVLAVLDRLDGSLPDGVPIVVRSTLPLHGPVQLAAEAGHRHRPILVNPEFMREGHALADFRAPSRVMVGHVRPADRDAAETFLGLYAPLGVPGTVADAASVVLVKLASNAFLGAKIAFVDEVARLSDAIGADVSVVADGLGLDPRIGRAYLDPGPGFGGSCLPEQAAAIAIETAARGLDTPLLASIGGSNEAHQAAIIRTLGSLVPGGLRNRRIALLGLAFKANTSDVRRAPALALAAGLRALGANVVGFDPVANEAATAADPELETAPTVEAAIAGADVAVVVTEWPAFAALDWAALGATMRGDLVYDTRRLLAPDRVRAAGLRYAALGRAGIAEPAGLAPTGLPARA